MSRTTASAPPGTEGRAHRPTRRWRRISAAGLACVAVATVLSVGTGAPAGAVVTDPFTVGYVWSSQPSVAGCYDASPYYSYNSRRLVNSICSRSTGGVGQYRVVFRGLASSGGNVQVTAYGPTAANCKVLGWFPGGADQFVDVDCYSPAGARQNAMFSASFTRGGGSANTIGFVWAHSPQAASYTPTATYQYNNRGGGLATVQRAATGAYSVSIPDSFGAAAAGSVKVTAYGGTSGVCKVVNWGPNADATAEVVNVQCYNSAGSPSDELFSLVYGNGMNVLGNNLMADGYVWGNAPSSASYTPSPSYQRSTTISSAGTVTITSAAAGSYDVFLPHQHQGLDGGNVQVTAYGPGTGRCQVGWWGQVSNGRSVRVFCFTNGGALTDTYFTMQYTAQLQ